MQVPGATAVRHGALTTGYTINDYWLHVAPVTCVAGCLWHLICNCIVGRLSWLLYCWLPLSLGLYNYLYT